MDTSFGHDHSQVDRVEVAGLGRDEERVGVGLKNIAELKFAGLAAGVKCTGMSRHKLCSSRITMAQIMCALGGRSFDFEAPKPVTTARTGFRPTAIPASAGTPIRAGVLAPLA